MPAGIDPGLQAIERTVAINSRKGTDMHAIHHVSSRAAPPRRTIPAASAALLLALAVGGCSNAPRPPSAEAATSAATAPPISRVPTTATVKLMTATGAVAGQAILTAMPTGVEIAVDAEGLAPGLHGFHIHANGTCAPGPDAATGQTVAFGAAGGHFDPGASHKHGQPGAPASVNHAGELPNLSADATGKATLRYLNTQVTLTQGESAVIGRSLVVHANADDYATNPAGNSGGRVLCGRIEPAPGETVVGQRNGRSSG
jgi:superoxide dismutase, Cu-Zn family